MPATKKITDRTRAQLLADLEELTREIYKDEPAENYDMDGAVDYWRRCCSDTELAIALSDAQQRLSVIKHPAELG